MSRFLLALALFASGCSVALQKRPEHATNCDRSTALAVIDGTIAAAAVAATVYGLSHEQPYAAGIGAPAAVLFTSSAVNGCR